MKNDYEIRGDVTVIFLERRNGEVVETIINTSDLYKTRQFPNKWYAYWEEHTKSFYVKGNTSSINGKRRTVMLHRWLFGEPEGMVVDHINNDTLDNRTENLRVITGAENCQNRKGATAGNKTSGIRGVHWNKKKKKWIAAMRVRGKQMHIGYFDNPDDAKVAVMKARAELMPFSKEAVMQEIVSGSLEAAATSEPLYSLKSFIDAVMREKEA